MHRPATSVYPSVPSCTIDDPLLLRIFRSLEWQLFGRLDVVNGLFGGDNAVADALFEILAGVFGDFGSLLGDPCIFLKPSGLRSLLSWVAEPLLSAL